MELIYVPVVHYLQFLSFLLLSKIVAIVVYVYCVILCVMYYTYVDTFINTNADAFTNMSVKKKCTRM